MNKIKRVYVAGEITGNGAHSTNSAIDYLINMRNMVRESVKVIFAGFTPFCPCLDFMYFLQLKDGERIKEASIKRLSKDWLEVCDAMILTEGWQRSAGTLAEIKFCKENNIPVFETLDELIKYCKEDKNAE